MNSIDCLDRIMNLQTPLVQSSEDDRIFMKLEGGSLNYNHKFRSAAYLVKKALEANIDLSKVADRSSGSWSMALSHCVYLAKGKSQFITTKVPHPYLAKIVESKNGVFKMVKNNSVRIEELNKLVHDEGWYTFNQHSNLDLINAFKETLGRQLVNDLNFMGISPKYIVAPVGTGGLLAGASLALKENKFATKIVGCDISSSIVNQAKRSMTYKLSACRGVGSEDEICHTFIESSKYIDEILVSNIYNTLHEMKRFTNRYPFTVGMSTCLALSVVKTHLLKKCRANESILIISPDRGETYTDEINCALKIYNGY
ncbi:PLP-dependent lyase/thiolase [Fluviispira multicolorata]|uniref:Pyridoxal-phosphate dependent enzyme n=1 Tax=Fluviispira multicolorata TaxID=2654512 RepID=A0A833JAY6_9BACT|nr:PLP-dependent lyase/thiolase [Fluviispira multicolorata]KAB8028573.1 pyridoxal-phosphate dependent enzyme [Fluviispira multicolorata]